MSFEEQRKRGAGLTCLELKTKLHRPGESSSASKFESTFSCSTILLSASHVHVQAWPWQRVTLAAHCRCKHRARSQTFRIDMSNVQEGAHVDAVKSNTFCVHHTDATNSIRLLQDKFYLTDNAVM